LHYIVAMSDSSLAAILRLLRAQSFVEARVDPGLGAIHGLALRELMFLMQLDQSPANRLRRVDLAGRLNVSQSTVTRLALPLEKVGFVKREADPRDARVGYVVLTKAGRQRVVDARATLEIQAKAIFRDRWTDKEIATLASLLGRFTAALPGDIT
jgi:DNA-binding MarR family transcriptional regulator